MASKDCKHNRLKARLQALGKIGHANGYCSQCQKFVDVEVPKPINGYEEKEAE